MASKERERTGTSAGCDENDQVDVWHSGWVSWSLTSLFSTNMAISETSVWHSSDRQVLE